MKLLKLEKYRCGACDRLGVYLEGAQLPHDVVNIEDNPEVAAKYQAMAAPILIALDDNGEEIDRVTGYFPEKVEEMLDKL